MDSVSKQQYVPPVRFCPFAQFENGEDEFRSIHFDETPIPSDDLVEFNKSLSISLPHLRPLDWCNNKEGTNNNLQCSVCRTPIVDTLFYSCKECAYSFPTSNLYFHKDCIEPISKHPYHPKHSLRYFQYLEGMHLRKTCLCCTESSLREYNCSICDFTICENCARNPPLLAIENFKRHEHTLFYFPRKGSLICEVCALSDRRSLMYSCRHCDFVVHKMCVDMPCIIRISRHEHRISFNSALTPEKWLCGVCRGKIDTNYGRYTCVKGCSFGVHSKCATRKDVWDGKELEGKPEDAYEDIKSFNEISDGIIQHFSHQDHHMRLDEETNRAFDEHKHCQACTLPICDDIIYDCVRCDFILHQECANLPRKKRHETHPHPLSLHVDYQDDSFVCKACDLRNVGFAYLCYERNCDYKLDVRCASIAEPLDHWCHQHPLFLTLEPGLRVLCSICHRKQGLLLACGECGFVVCFRCATLPYKLRYKHDEHVLILSYEEDSSGEYLCEICEKEANPKYGIYMCNDCNVTLHIRCLLGKNMYMMPGRKVHCGRLNVLILLNNRLTRSICSKCHRRCEEKTVYKISDREICCSWVCLLLYSFSSL